MLEVGTLEETITVTGDAPLIETTNASKGGASTRTDFKELPTAGRSVFLMATLEPTVEASGNAHWNRMQDQSGNSALSMGGGAVRAEQLPDRRLPGDRPAEPRRRPTRAWKRCRR